MMGLPPVCAYAVAWPFVVEVYFVCVCNSQEHYLHCKEAMKNEIDNASDLVK